jgi:hypothetical protein
MTAPDRSSVLAVQAGAVPAVAARNDWDLRPNTPDVVRLDAVLLAGAAAVYGITAELRVVSTAGPRPQAL